MGRTKSYDGEGITVRFEARRCIHAAKCVGHLPGVFNVDKRPWIDARGASVDEIVRVVEMCPSGALTYERSDGGPPEAIPDGPPRVATAADGPLYVRGAIEVVDHEGRAITVGPRVALCRCGASKNKPYCDNSHVEAGFTAA